MFKTFFKIVGIMVILIVLFYYLIFNLIFNVVDKVDTAIDANKELVGEFVVVDNDTLMIINYDVINSEYDLKGGETMSVELAKKLLIKKEDNE